MVGLPGISTVLLVFAAPDRRCALVMTRGVDQARRLSGCGATPSTAVDFPGSRMFVKDLLQLA